MKLDILKAAQSRAWTRAEYPVSQFMHDANVSWPTLQKLLGELEESCLMTNTTKGTLRSFRHVYSLTARGRQAIRIYDELSKLVNEKPISALED